MLRKLFILIFLYCVIASSAVPELIDRADEDPDHEVIEARIWYNYSTILIVMWNESEFYDANYLVELSIDGETETIPVDSETHVTKQLDGPLSCEKVSAIVKAIDGDGNILEESNFVGWPPLKKLSITPNDTTYTVQWDQWIGCDDVLENEYVLYELKIQEGFMPLRTFHTTTNNMIFSLPGNCMNISVSVVRIWEDGSKSPVSDAWFHTNYIDGFESLSNVHPRETRVKLTLAYAPPLTHSYCPYNYELTLWDNETMVDHKVTKENYYEFNFLEEKILCKELTLQLKPTLLGASGKSLNFTMHTDNFDEYIDIGPPFELETDLEDVLTIYWQPPLGYETCEVLYTAEIYNANTHKLLKSYALIAHREIVYDFAADNVHGIRIEISVTSYYKTVEGGYVGVRLDLP